MIVAVGTLREPKIEAVRSVFAQLGSKYPVFQNAEILARDVDSGTLETPVRIHHLMEGALNRVRNLCEIFHRENREADIFIGLEGGVHKIDDGAFLQSWVYIVAEGYSGYGSSGNLPLPETIVRALYEENRSLGKVIDEFAGKTGIRDNQGTFGILTDMFITRKQSFETALFAGLAPIYNSATYQL